MKQLGLLRHAKSDWNDMALRDFDRGLNDRGRRGAAIIGGHIRDHGVKWDIMLASPAERVRRTVDATRLTMPVRWDEHIYLADSDALIQIVQHVRDDIEAVLLVGHNPGLQELVFDLVAPDAENDLFAEVAVKYPTAAFAVMELSIDRWADCEPGCGKLVHLVRPRDLDPELGPEDVR